MQRIFVNTNHKNVDKNTNKNVTVRIVKINVTRDKMVVNNFDFVETSYESYETYEIMTLTDTGTCTERALVHTGCPFIQIMPILYRE